MRGRVRVGLQAALLVLRQHADVWRLTWRQRKLLDPPRRLAQEREFLPAALALQDTPVSPLPRLAMWLLIGFLLIALLWSCIGQVDVVAVAGGKVIPNGHTKTIQSMEAAVVRQIRVTDGQRVRAGEVLIALDTTGVHADRDRIRGELAVVSAQLARSQAMLAGLGLGRLPAMARPAGVDDALWSEAIRLAQGQFDEFVARRRRIEAEVARREAELKASQALVHKLELTLPFARQREASYKDLAERQFVSRHGYMEREQARIELEADLAAQRSRQQETTEALGEARARLVELDTETRRIQLQGINDSLQKTAALEQDRIKADMRTRWMTLTAPVDGTVQQLAVHTVGGVVTPAQPLMLVVPRDGALEVEAFVANKDVGFVHAGQLAEIKVETFQFTRYGTIPATVVSVSHDAINDERRGLVYAARIRLHRTSIRVDGREVGLAPGMAVSAEIKTGTRRVIDFFLSPLQQYRDESLQER